MRKIRFDVLKVVAMFGIVSIHAIYQADMLSLVPRLSAAWLGLKLVYTGLFPMTNVFTLLSCSFLCEGKFKGKKIIKMLLFTIGYSTIIYLSLCMSNYRKFCVTELAECLLAPFVNQYWYISAYVLLYVLSPHLNKMLNALSKRELLSLCACGLTAFSVLPSILVFVPAQNLLDPTNGKGILWFVTLYCVVFYIKKYEMERIRRIKSRCLCLTAVGSILLMLLSSMVFYNISTALGLGGDGADRLYFDSSLLVTLVSICLYLLALKGREQPGTRCVPFLAGTTLGVYLIHEQPQLKTLLWKTVRKLMESGDLPVPASGILCIVVVFGASVAVECTRKFLWYGIDQIRERRYVNERKSKRSH